MRAALLIAVMAFVLSHDAHGALPTLELLSPQNLHRLEQVGQIRRGTLEEIAWSPGEDMIAVAGSGGLRLFSLIDGREQALLSNAGGVNDVDFSPDGREIVAAGDDGLLHIWDSQTGAALRALGFSMVEELPVPKDRHLLNELDNAIAAVLPEHSDPALRRSGDEARAHVAGLTATAVKEWDARRVLRRRELIKRFNVFLWAIGTEVLHPRTNMGIC